MAVRHLSCDPQLDADLAAVSVQVMHERHERLFDTNAAMRLERAARYRSPLETVRRTEQGLWLGFAGDAPVLFAGASSAVAKVSMTVRSIMWGGICFEVCLGNGGVETLMLCDAIRT